MSNGYEWNFVMRETVEGLLPHRAKVQANHAIDQGVPGDPLGRLPPPGLHFSIEFMKKFAEAKHPKMTCPVFTSTSVTGSFRNKLSLGLQNQCHGRAK